MPEEPAPEPDKGERTFNQADVDRIVQERLAKERGKYGDLNELRRKASAYEELEQSQKTELQKAAEARQEAERKATDAETRAMRLEIGTAAGLTPAQSRRLQGSTKEEFEADAAELATDLGVTKDAPPDPKEQRPKERLTPVPLEGAAKEQAEKTDMNAWMRAKTGSE